MRHLVLTAALIASVGVAVLWLQGGLDGVARWAMEGQREFQNAMAGVLRSLTALRLTCAWDGLAPEVGLASVGG